jgi:hypothetical protein
MDRMELPPLPLPNRRAVRHVSSANLRETLAVNFARTVFARGTSDADLTREPSPSELEAMRRMLG